MEEKYNGLKIAEKGARISIIAYIVLALLKLGIGHLSSSKALTADGLNNTTDIVASLAVLIGLKYQESQQMMIITMVILEQKLLLHLLPP